MSEDEYRTALEKQGVHSSVVVLSTRPVLAVSAQDFWMRGFVGLLATVTVAGLGLAWRTLLKSADLEIRLARAAELNARLREMNLAATGLAQETREPLALIRELAQNTAQHRGASDAIQRHAQGIVSETERVAAQLNDFINYSRPREVRRAPVALGAVVSELVAALGPELRAKAIRLEVPNGLPAIEADEALLRQALFNLFTNAIRAMDHEGGIRVTAAPPEAGLVTLEIRDDGPDVLPEHRADIFKPYFTSNQRGRGLGLAVTHQIVQAHGWEIECRENTPRGALFRISHLRATAPA
jgi:signal transduction histidine kinase